MSEVAEIPMDAPDQSESGDRSVKPFELFFDLVFVFAFTQVTQFLASDPSWEGMGLRPEVRQSGASARHAGHRSIVLQGRQGSVSQGDQRAGRSLRTGTRRS